MTRRRWLADEVHGERAALVGKHAQHLSRVLRARVGQEYDISAAGRLRRGRVVAVSDARVEFALGEELPAPAEPEVTLLLAIYKFDRMEWALEKLTELGAARIVPVISQRSDAHLAKAAAKRVERWRRIAQEAAEQSRRLAPPEVVAPARLKDAVATTALTRVVLEESAQAVSLADVVRVRHPSAGETVALAIGPEGGWTEDELRLFAESGWTAASLGQRILRAETAAVAAMAIVTSYPL